METWMWWIVGAIAFLIAEIFVSGTLLFMCVAGACLVCVPVTLLGGGWIAQSLTFSGVVVVLGVTVRRWAGGRRHMSAHTNVDAIPGSRGRIVSAATETESARMTLEGLEWSARRADGRPLCVGEVVRVVRVEGVTLVVSPD